MTLEVIRLCVLRPLRGQIQAKEATQNIGTDPIVRSTCSTGTQKHFPNKGTEDVGTSPGKKNIVSTGVSTIRPMPTVSTGSTRSARNQ